MSVLGDLVDGEAKNLEWSRQRIDDTSTLVDDLEGLYETLSRMIDNSGVPPRDEIVMGGMLLSGCRYCLTKACLEVLRGHLTDSLGFSRKAIEQCAFAYKIKKHPKLAMDWIKANDSEAAYEVYRKKFGGKGLFPKGVPLLEVLGSRYDFCSKAVHSSIYSLAQRMEFESSEKKFRILYNLFEINENDKSEPVRMYLWTLDTHLGIIRVMEKVFEEAINSDLKRWEVRRNGVDARLGVHKEKWRASIPVPTTLNRG